MESSVAAHLDADYLADFGDEGTLFGGCKLAIGVLVIGVATSLEGGRGPALCLSDFAELAVS